MFGVTSTVPASLHVHNKDVILFVPCKSTVLCLHGAKCHLNNFSGDTKNSINQTDECEFLKKKKIVIT